MNLSVDVGDLVLAECANEECNCNNKVVFLILTIDKETGFGSCLCDNIVRPFSSSAPPTDTKYTVLK